MFVVWLLLNILVFSCAPADSNIIRRCRFSRWVVVVRSDSSDDSAWSLTAPQVGMLHMCSIRCCSFFHFASFFRRVVCVRCEVCFVVVYVRLFWVCFGQIDVVSAKFRYVIARAFGVF